MPPVRNRVDHVMRSPVFVDATGRRRAWVAWALGMGAVVCVGYVLLLGFSFAGGPIRPGDLLPVPALKNSQKPPTTPTSTNGSTATPGGTGGSGSGGVPTPASSGPIAGGGAGATAPGSRPRERRPRPPRRRRPRHPRRRVRRRLRGRRPSRRPRSPLCPRRRFRPPEALRAGCPARVSQCPPRPEARAGWPRHRTGSAPIESPLQHASATTRHATCARPCPDADESARAAVGAVLAARADSLRAR